MPQLTPSQILSSPQSSEFTKFRNWLLKHSDTQPCITLRHFTQPMDPHYHEFRQTAIKSQLSDGFALILNYEQFVRDRLPTSPPTSPDHPFPAGRRLAKVANLWTTVCRHQALSAFLQTEIDRIVQRKFAEAKRTISHLLSFLAAMDAIPLEYIPVIQFDSVSYNDAGVLANDERCVGLGCRRDAALKEIAEIRERIVAISGNYLTGGSESQIALFHTLIGAQRVHYNSTTRTLAAAADVGAVADYIKHPNSIAQPMMRKLAEERTGKAFAVLTREVAEVFQLQSRDEIVIASLVLSAVIEPLFWIELKAEEKGEGALDGAVIGLALELMTIGDPVAFLLCVGGKASPERLQGSVDAALVALKAITGEWREICAFVYEATVAEYLSATLNTVRFALGQAIESE